MICYQSYYNIIDHIPYVYLHPSDLLILKLEVYTSKSPSLILSVPPAS